jgi:PIN like domain
VKILLDENVPLPLTSALKVLLRSDHEVVHVTDLGGWSGTKDQPLYGRAATNGFQLILTNDTRQMQRRHEVEAIAESGLHRVEYRHRHSGLVGVGLAMASVCGSMPILLRELAKAEGQRLVTLKSLDPSPDHRFTVRDPAADPPKHWPSA